MQHFGQNKLRSRHCDSFAGFLMMPALMHPIKAYPTLLLLFHLATFSTGNHATFCKAPPPIPYGQLKEEYMAKNEFAKDTKVTYMCRPGYTRVPFTRTSIICLDNYTWSVPEVFCIRRACGNPGEVTNAEMDAEDFLFGSRLTFVCKQGHKMISKYNYRECLADGSWSNALPECEVVSCTSPPTITKGFFRPVKDDYTYLDSVTYTCNGASSLIGEQSLACNEKGEWSPDAPECRAIQCLDPSVPHARKLSGILGPYFLNSAVKFACSPGYVLNGSDIVKCNINSQWEPELPTCTAIKCPNPSVPHARKLYGYLHTYVWSSAVKFACFPGYVLNGSDIVKCNINSQWEPELPTCTAIQCLDPSVPHARKLSGNLGPYFLNSAVKFACSPGYVLNGSDIVKCNLNSQWEPELPTCTAIKCPDPSVPHARELLESVGPFVWNSAVKFACSPGYVLNGSDIVKCNLNSQWEPELPTCTVVSCPSPPTITKGFFYPVKDYYTYLDSVTYTCNGTSSLIGEQSLACNEKGEWSPDAPECRGTSCGTPEGIAHGKMEYENVLLGSRIIYTCDPGYTMVSGRSFRECQTDGMCSGTAPVCKESMCDKIWELQEAVRICTSTPDDWIKYLQVQYLYLQIENLKLDIEIKKNNTVLT
ncbi:CUB and sushi domain-containing protein 3-like isoform X3 [Pseudophryne corroboree]|uniref:CUB and sushi domain-containing protein 3-like isoform X3 n=1 Tax=Pseudophryne corroboree TaxID=495146 RepID=UPI003081DC74